MKDLHWLVVEYTDQAWRDGAACRRYPTDLFFPGQGSGIIQARAICGFCPVWPECLAYALAIKPEIGVWAGTDRRDRQALTAGRLTMKILKARIREAVNAWTPPTF